MTHELAIEITGWILAGLAGWLLRGGLTQRHINSIRRDEQRAHAVKVKNLEQRHAYELGEAKTQGYYEALALTESARQAARETGKPQMWRAK